MFTNGHAPTRVCAYVRLTRIKAIKGSVGERDVTSLVRPISTSTRMYTKCSVQFAKNGAEKISESSVASK